MQRLTFPHHAWQRRVSDYHSGGVSAAERATVEAHLVTCPECQEALAMYRRFYTLLRSPLQLDSFPLHLQFGPEGAGSVDGATVPGTPPRSLIAPHRRPDSSSSPGTPGAPGGLPRRPSGRVTAAAAIAALLVIALLAGCCSSCARRLETVQLRTRPHLPAVAAA
jgi:anti-sigma factor RsiW